MNEETLPFLIGVLRRRDRRQFGSFLIIFFLLCKCFSLFVNNLLGEVNQEQSLCLFI